MPGAAVTAVAFMFKAVMAYHDNLIAWGDSLFRGDTSESVDAARQIYVLLANLLGPKAQKVPRKGFTPAKSYAQLRSTLDEFGKAAAALEAEILFDLDVAPGPVTKVEAMATLRTLGASLYFCIPANERLLGYWDTVADRLFKIRNSLNLQGVFRQLPLFEPPIDPALLARATAAWLDTEGLLGGKYKQDEPDVVRREASIAQPSDVEGRIVSSYEAQELSQLTSAHDSMQDAAGKEQNANVAAFVPNFETAARPLRDVWLAVTFGEEE